MSWGAAIGGLAGLASAYVGAQANRAAARDVANATRDAQAFQQNQLDLTREDLAPYREGGLADYQALRAAVGPTFQASPGYEFARGEGIRAIDQAASARGMLGSGGRLRELTRYGTGVANQEYGNWLSRLQTMAGFGPSATQASGQFAMGSGIPGLIAQQGQARAAGTVGPANALLGGANTGLGLYALLRDQPAGNRNAMSGFSQGSGLAGIF
jgi:hypothetical protein